MIVVVAGFCVQLGLSFVIPPLPSLNRNNYDHERDILLQMSSAAEVPTIEELSKDPFMKQVSHAQTLVDLLLSETEGQQNESDLEALLTAQLSHSDGIRGFFVTYLTGSDENDGAMIKVPEVLQKAMAQVDAEELVPLACMNVVMPTGMITMHEDPTLSQSSRLTSQRGSRILECLLEFPLARDNCQAILSVATDGNDPTCKNAKSDMVEYWREFFDKWGYKDKQKKDIATAISNILS